MKGLLSLVRRTTPSSFAYICEKMGSSLIDKVAFSTQKCHMCLIGGAEMKFYLSLLFDTCADG